MRICTIGLALALAGTIARAEDAPAPSWLTADVQHALRDGTLTLKLAPAQQTIETFATVHIELHLTNSGGADLRLPTWLALISAEIVPQDVGARGVYWWRQTWHPNDLLPKEVAKANCDLGSISTAVHFASQPLAGLPDGGRLLPGRYRWRLVVQGAPDFASNWVDITVAPPAPTPAMLAAAQRRPNGRLLLVSPTRQPPNPTGSVEAPFPNVLAATVAAKPGDIIYCQGARYRHVTQSFCVPDDVWLVGEGAGNTVISVIGAGNGPAEPLVRLSGKCRVEGVTIMGSDSKSRGSLVRADGKEAQPALFQCALIPADQSFATFECWHDAAPTLRNCIIISPIGGYGVFARHRANPTLESCTIVSRGFGVGMMDGAVPNMRRCIIAGQCPAIISDGVEIAISQSIVWCPTNCTTYPDPVMTRSSTDRTPAPEVLKQPGMGSFDPRFAAKGNPVEFLSVKPDSEAAEYGAFAGDGGKWPATGERSPMPGMPELIKCLCAPREGD